MSKQQVTFTAILLALSIHAAVGGTFTATGSLSINEVADSVTPGNPEATFTGTNGSIDGELIAGSVTGETAELESGDIFNGNLATTATPEPSTWLLFVVALIPVAIRAGRPASRRYSRPTSHPCSRMRDRPLLNKRRAL